MTKRTDHDAPVDDAALEAPQYTFPAYSEKELDTLKLGASLVRKVGEAAAKACQKASISDNEALALAGYAEEAGYFIDKRENGKISMTRRHWLVIKQGLLMILAKIREEKEDQTELLVEEDRLDERATEVAALFRRLAVDDQMEIPVEEPKPDEYGEVPAADTGPRKTRGKRAKPERAD